MTRSAVLLALAPMLLPAHVAGQTVRGTVRDTATQQPVPGAFVILRDSTSRARLGVLTDSAGRFIMRAPAAGTWQIRADRIGYDSTTTTTFSLANGETKAFELNLAIAPLKLSEVAVRADRRCAPNPQTGAETARVWDEARKALTVAAWVSADESAQFRIRHFDRELDRNLELIGDEVMSFDHTYGQRAFSTLPPDSLAELGFMQRVGKGLDFFGPDAHVLIDPTFLALHCFRVIRDRNRPGAIGLAFEPIRGRRVPDIQGALWLDEKTAALRSIDYTFTNLGFYVDSRFARGRTVYEQLANGAWFVRSWELRMPNVAESPSGRRVAEGAHETGAEVLDVIMPGGTEIALVPSFTVSGVAFDSVRSRPLTYARAFLAGTPFEATTDERGRFSFEHVPIGTYYLRVAHARLDSIPAAPPNMRVLIDSTTGPLTISTPSANTLLARYCSARDLNRLAAQQGTTTNRLGVLRVRVIDEQTDAPAARAQVQASWTRGPGYDPRFPAVVASTTNVDGMATLCGVPRDTAYTLAVSRDDRIAQLTRATLPSHGVLQLTVRLPR